MKTATPRSAAVARSTWLVPMQKQPMASRSGAFSRTLRGDGGVGADAEQRHPGQRRQQLVLRHGAGRGARPRTRAARGSRRRRGGCSRAAGPSRVQGTEPDGPSGPWPAVRDGPSLRPCLLPRAVPAPPPSSPWPSACSRPRRRRATSYAAGLADGLGRPPPSVAGGAVTGRRDQPGRRPAAPRCKDRSLRAADLAAGVVPSAPRTVEVTRARPASVRLLATVAGVVADRRVRAQRRRCSIQVARSRRRRRPWTSRRLRDLRRGGRSTASTRSGRRRQLQRDARRQRRTPAPAVAALRRADRAPAPAPGRPSRLSADRPPVSRRLPAPARRDRRALDGRGGAGARRVASATGPPPTTSALAAQLAVALPGPAPRATATRRATVEAWLQPAGPHCVVRRERQRRPRPTGRAGPPGDRVTSGPARSASRRPSHAARRRADSAGTARAGRASPARRPGHRRADDPLYGDYQWVAMLDPVELQPTTSWSTDVTRVTTGRAGRRGGPTSTAAPALEPLLQGAAPCCGRSCPEVDQQVVGAARPSSDEDPGVAVPRRLRRRPRPARPGSSWPCRPARSAARTPSAPRQLVPEVDRGSTRSTADGVSRP